MKELIDELKKAIENAQSHMYEEEVTDWQIIDLVSASSKVVGVLETLARLFGTQRCESR